MTAHEHELLCRLKQEVDSMREELVGFVKKSVLWVVVGAFSLGGWSAAIQAQVFEHGRQIDRLDTRGTNWGRDTKEDLDRRFLEIREALARIEERLSARGAR